MKRILAILMAVMLVCMTAANVFAAESGTAVVEVNDEGTEELTLSDGTVVVTVSDEDKEDGEVEVPAAVEKGSEVSVAGLEDDETVTVTLPVEDLTNTTVVVDKDGNIVEVEYTDDGLVFDVTGESTYTVCEAEDLFNDIEDHYAKQAIAETVAKRLMVGKGNGNFDPNGELSVAMVYTVLARMLDADIVTTGPQWLENVTKWAIEQGIADELDPNLNVTREQMVNYMAKAAGVEGNPIDWAVETGLIEGYEDGSLGLEKNLTRGEFATVLARFMTK